MTNHNKRVYRIAGGLIILGLVSGILSIVPSVESPDYLEAVFPNRNQVYAGAVFQFLLVPIYLSFALLWYPILKHHNERLAIGFLGFRFMASTFQLLGITLLPLFVFLSQEYASSDPAQLQFFEYGGGLLRLFRDLINHIGIILATGLGNLLFYQILFRHKLLPNWLTTWGIIGNLLIMLAGFFILFQQVEVISPSYMLMSIPLVLQEVVLAVWLMVRGLKPPILKLTYK